MRFFSKQPFYFFLYIFCIIPQWESIAGTNNQLIAFYETAQW